MAWLLLAGTAFLVSFLTLFTGFGLGTLLLPVFALFFPVQMAVASTAIVHGANNLFKVALLFRDVDRRLMVRFGIPAVMSAVIGAYLLSLLSLQDMQYTWEMFGRKWTTTPLRIVMAVIILGFAFFELAPGFRSFRVSDRWLPLGGVLSGFFGGLSGHQGALRAAFMGSLDISPGTFAATQALLGFSVDFVRLGVYWFTFLRSDTSSDAHTLPVFLIATAVVSAFAGALLGKRFLPAVTISFVKNLTGVLLIIIGTALGLGLT
jgi:uncharacterized membrane protein YfcA